MKKMLFLWLMLQPFVLLAWQGDVSYFQYNNGLFTLNAPAVADTAYIATPCSVAVNAQWQATILLQYVPSSANVVRMYLMADTSCLTFPLQGYYVQVGGAQKNISLYRQDGTKGHLLLTAPQDVLWQAPVQVHVRVSRLLDMRWRLQYALGNGIWVETDSVTDATYTQNKAWGLWCKYTKTRNQAFAFSNLQAVGDTCALPLLPPVEQLVLSEILYDPFPGGVDFVELYNASHDTIALGRCEISNGKKSVKLPQYELGPHAYVAVTPSDSILLEQYPESCFDHFLQVPSLPNFVNDSGKVYVLSSGQVLDSLCYSDKMHHAYLNDTEGVSLERESHNKAVWFSAASTVLATPGCENSQADRLPNPVLPTDKPFWLSNGWFAPQEQYVSLFHQVEAGSIANAWVYNLQGVSVYQLYNNALLSASGSTYWDGRDSAGNPCEEGIYVIAIEWITALGETKRLKIPVALGR